ncbi:amidohydrolase family protein [Alkalihalobacillus sp. BA299]|uniref:amidohydrolase family protein n=1 Tax=Alkalihalobacillus sp. BA299 TaxID=2815938 RepID=UPI001ADBB192|nr:amidohydrolase family protein [Alkalihalobacillus sp. BA299]
MKKVIKNVRFEGKVRDLVIENGLIQEIVESEMETEVFTYDAKGLLYLPTLADMHCHLDKHLLGESWRSLQPFTTLSKQLKFEKELLSSMENSVATRALILAEVMLKQGTTKIRTHVDVDPELGLKHLEAVLELREQLKELMEIEIVAFPQQGLLRSNSVGIMKEALRNGADLVGGVDPAGLDRRVEASLEAMFDLSVEFNAGIDLHLHDPGHLGVYTIDLVTDYTRQTQKQGRVAVSHAYCLGMVADTELSDTMNALKEASVSIISSVPIDRPMPRIETMVSAGVTFQVGTDNIRDAWSPYGNGDMLQRGSRLAEKNGWVTDELLTKAYSFITNRSLTPKVGEKADFMLVDAQNIKDAIASVPKREAVFSKGNLISGEEHQLEGEYISR